MNNDELLEWIEHQAFRAGMNIDYYQSMSSFWYTVNACLVVIAIGCGAYCVYVSRDSKDKILARYSFVASLISLVMMAIFLVLPIADAANADTILVQRWSDVRHDVESFQIDARFEDLKQKTIAERQKAVEEKVNAIRQSESMPLTWWLKVCWSSQAERTYGKGINTWEKVQAERERIERGDPPTAQNHPATLDAPPSLALRFLGAVAAVATTVGIWWFLRRRSKRAMVASNRDAGQAAQAPVDQPVSA